jgi:hypothetical protein
MNTYTVATVDDMAVAPLSDQEIQSLVVNGELAYVSWDAYHIVRPRDRMIIDIPAGRLHAMANATPQPTSNDLFYACRYYFDPQG